MHMKGHLVGLVIHARDKDKKQKRHRYYMNGLKRPWVCWLRLIFKCYETFFFITTCAASVQCCLFCRKKMSGFTTFIDGLYTWMNHCCTCRILWVSPHLLVHSLVSASTWGGIAGIAGVLFTGENIKTPDFHWQRMTHLFLILMQLLLYLHRGRQLPTGNLE